MPPYNIMSTAAPRGEKEERSFTLQAAATWGEQCNCKFFTSGGRAGCQHPPAKPSRLVLISTMRCWAKVVDRTCGAVTADNEVDDIVEGEEEQ